MINPDFENYRLSPQQLLAVTLKKDLDFSSLEDLPTNFDFLGQERAKAALEFGLDCKRAGYNLFVMGESGTGRISLIMRYLKESAQDRRSQPDWIYANNFDEPNEPWAIQLPAGHGKQFLKDCQSLVRKLLVVIPAAFENPSYQRKKKSIDKTFNQQFETAISNLEKEAESRNIAVYQDALNISFTPMEEGKPMDDLTFSGLSREEKDEVNEAINELEDKLNEALVELPLWKRENYEQLQTLNSSTIDSAISGLLSELQEKYRGLTGIQIYLNDVKSHLIDIMLENLELLETPERRYSAELKELLQNNLIPNLLVANDPDLGAPVVYEPHPTYINLFGRIEYWNEAGVLSSSYKHVRAGAFHRANGGYLILEAEKIFDDPYIWEQLKRTLQTQELKLEPVITEGQHLVSVTINPHAVPVNVEVILVGSREHYYLLQEHDAEFGELFRVLVDFDEKLKRTPESIRQFAYLIKSHAEKEGFGSVEVEAFLELVSFSSRLCEEQSELSSRFGEVLVLLGEADVIRVRESAKSIHREHVLEALQLREARHDRIRIDMQESMIQGHILILTEGSLVGSINGLTIWEMGSNQFGLPARITATVFPGTKGIVDIERESDLGLSIHSKGVLIWSGYLANRYAKAFPLTLSANIVMEQSYGFIDGDSAALAELCALISAIVEVPIRQTMAVTGSINQFGEVQAIGGVNEKIEGFFELCAARGLTGEQGVIIPKANESNLMLSHKVIAAVKANQFHIFSVETVDEALSLLLVHSGGSLDELHQKITEHLKELYRICDNQDNDDEDSDNDTSEQQSPEHPEQRASEKEQKVSEQRVSEQQSTKGNE